MTTERPIATGRKSRPKRLGGQLKSVEKGKRVNPKVIRSVLFEWINEEFDRDIGAAAIEVSNSITKNRSIAYKSALSSETLYDIINERTQLKYVHLDMICNHLKIPVSMLLAFTRLRSEIEKEKDGSSTDFLKIADGMTRFLKDLVELIEELDKETAGRDKKIEALGYLSLKTLCERYDNHVNPKNLFQRAGMDL